MLLHDQIVVGCIFNQINILSLDIGKILKRVNIGLLICLGIFICFDKGFLGLALIFPLTGTLSLVAFYYNTEPLWMGWGGFDYAMNMLLKEYYNRYFNLMVGLIQFILGLGAFIEIFA